MAVKKAKKPVKSGKSSTSRPLKKAAPKPAAKKAKEKVVPAKVVPSTKRPGMEFIGTFPMRKDAGDKKAEAKKQPTGPFFPQGSYSMVHRPVDLPRVLAEEFKTTFLSKHLADTLSNHSEAVMVDKDPALYQRTPRPAMVFTRELDEALISKKYDIAVHNMKDIPLELPQGLVLAAALRREDPRDALITRATYGAVQELPHKAKVGTTSKRRIMQVRALRPDIEIVSLFGNIHQRMEKLEKGEVDAIICAWATLRRLNISPRFYVALQPEQMIPAACQGSAGVVCRAEDVDLVNKLRYIEDSETSWSARCERAFLAKLAVGRDVPVGVYAHRKGTQDPWLLDAIIGDPRTGEVLRHREIGTSRCKPESLADKAFVGILAKGARKFLPFQA